MARAQDAGHLHRNFMGYTIHASSDLVGFGASAISHIGASFSQNRRDVAGYLDAIDRSESPLQRGLALSDDDVLRAEVIQQVMCQGVLDIRVLKQRFGIDFGRYFAADIARLAPLVADGLVEIGPDRLTATPRGRMLLRHVAMSPWPSTPICRRTRRPPRWACRRAGGRRGAAPALFQRHLIDGSK